MYIHHLYSFAVLTLHGVLAEFSDLTELEAIARRSLLLCHLLQNVGPVEGQRNLRICLTLTYRTLLRPDPLRKREEYVHLYSYTVISLSVFVGPC